MTEEGSSVAADRALFIKLGKGGVWESSSLHEDQTVRLGYHEIPTDLANAAAISGDWGTPYKILLDVSDGDVGTAKRHLIQVREFFEADDTVIWITFAEGQMWWCRSFRKISPMPDGHVRPVIGCWAKEDVRGRPLEISSLSGKLTATQGFRGTVCSVGEFEYLLNRINGELPEAVRAAEEARDALRDRIEALISGLHWRDFEILVDLIFRGAGLQRVSELGKTLKEIDLDLLAPLTNERYAAQVKSRAGLRELQHLEDAFTDLHGFSRVYLVVHTPQAGLRDAAPAEPLEVLGPRQLADLSLRYGLTEWIIARAS